MPKELVDFHNPYFDPLVREAHGFTNQQLGLQTSGIDQLTVIDESNIDAIKLALSKEGSIGGGFDIPSGDIVVFAEGDTLNPAGATAKLGSKLVHELTHSGTANLNQHNFYNEALAGMGEAKYLQWLAEKGRWQPPVDFILKRAGVELQLLGGFRYYEPAIVNGNSSQGLIAALGVGLGMHRNAVKVADVMAASSLRGENQFAIMHSSLDSLKPGLAKEVTTFPETTDGIIQATAAIQEVARGEGILK